MTSAEEESKSPPVVSQPALAGSLATVRRGFAISPELTRGAGMTITLAVIATLGRVIVPLSVQQGIDRGLSSADGPHPGVVAWTAGIALVCVALTAWASAATNIRLFKSSEAGLKTLRVRAFQQIHDMDILTMAAHRRGVLVARVTSDVDTISNFVQWGGLILALSAVQLVVATVLMAVYSWPMTLVVWGCFAPLVWLMPRLQGIVAKAYAGVRERVGDLLAAVAETVSGAVTIRSFGVRERTQRRVDAAVAAHARAATRAQLMVALSFSIGFLVSTLVVAVVVGVGLTIGLNQGLTLGRLLAFIFLVNLFTTPVQLGTESLNQLQDALAGWRRVIAVIDQPVGVADPGPEGRVTPRGPATLSLQGVTLTYPDGRTAVCGVDLELAAGRRVAIVGRTGSGKTTLARLLTRLIDPTGGVVRLDGVDLREITTESLRARVVLVPQEVYLLDGSLMTNIVFGHESPESEGAESEGAESEGAEARVRRVLTELGLLDWAESLPQGLQTPLGPAGASLSAGERQFVALARAHLSDPDVLVLDEATSAVDPAAELGLQTALESLVSKRTAIAIAHRLSTAERADLVVVVDAGEVVATGTHHELLASNEVYRRLHASWTHGAHGDAHGDAHGAGGL